MSTSRSSRISRQKSASEFKNQKTKDSDGSKTNSERSQGKTLSSTEWQISKQILQEQTAAKWSILTQDKSPQDPVIYACVRRSTWCTRSWIQIYDCDVTGYISVSCYTRVQGSEPVRLHHLCYIMSSIPHIKKFVIYFTSISQYYRISQKFLLYYTL